MLSDVLRSAGPIATPAPSIRDRTVGCWLGKAVGGTLGQTFEGLEGPLNADFYYPVPQGMVPNDDLDLQVLYAVILSQLAEPRVDPLVLAAAWQKHVRFPWNEYGVGQRNYAEGIRPPYTGAFDNWFTCGEGAAIRSELWACLANGDADLAAEYAFADACFDHAGDGIHAAQFLARLQTRAFFESDRDSLLDQALAGIPTTSGVHRAVQDTRRWFAETGDWVTVRSRIMADYGNSDFTDVRPNTAFVVLGWLAGKDFAESICITNNCGQDCDSSTASLGALLGILDPFGIPESWLAPIGRQIVLNNEVEGIDPPATIDEFTDLVIDLGARLAGAPAKLSREPFEPAEHAIEVDIAWHNTNLGKWEIRDHTELPPAGASLPTGLAWQPASLPGTVVRKSRDEFEDRILFIRYQVNSRGERSLRLMVNSTEHYRVWWDGAPLLAAQGSQFQFPAPHMPPVGQFVDFEVESDLHELVVALRVPPADRAVAEWVVALVERPGFMWIPNAFRPSRTITTEMKH